MVRRVGSRVVVGAVIAAALAIGIWLLWSPAPAGQKNVAAGPTGQDAAAAVAGGAPAGTDGALAGPERIEARPPDVAAAGGDANARWLTVRRRDTKAAVPAAEVWLVPGEKLLPEPEPVPPGASARIDDDLAELARRHGSREVADAVGRVRLPDRTDPLFAIGAAAGMFGRAIVLLSSHAPAAGDTLWLERDVTLRVHVVDAAGAPQAAVPLAMGWLLQQYGQERRRQRAASITGDDGMATIAHAQIAPDIWSPAILSAWVTFTGPGFAGPGVAVDLAAPPTAPIELVLPGTGSIVAVVDPACADGEASVMVYGLDAAGQRSEVSDYGMRVVPGSGRVEFDHVCLGQRFHSSLRSGVVWAQQDFPGPTRPGEEVVIALELPRQLLLRGRAVQDDQPLVRQRLRYEIYFSDAKRKDADGRLVPRPRAQGTTFTDQDGHFAMRFDRELGGAVVNACSIYRLADQRQPDHALAWLDIQQLPAAGERDLGDVVLQVPPLLVEGQVVFEDGTPCRDQALSIDLPREPGQSVVEWQQRSMHLRVGGKGEHFTVRGRFDGAQLRLSLGSQHAVAAAGMTVPVPSRDVRLVVARAGSITARVCADGGFDPGFIEVFLRSLGGERLQPASLDSEAIDGQPVMQHWLGGLRAGSYDFCASLAGQPQTEVRVRDVVVRAGEETRDPRLFDLVFAARKVRLRLLDSHSGGSIAGRAVVIFDRPQVGRWSGFDFFAPGEIVVRGSPDGIVCALDHEPTPLHIDADELTVRLPPCTVPTTLAIAAAPAEIPAGVQLRLRLDPVLTADEQQHPDTPGGGASMADFLGRVARNVDLPWTGDAVVSPPRGRYRFRLELRAANGSAPIDGLEPAEFDLQMPGRVSLRVQAEAWQRALAALPR